MGHLNKSNGGMVFQKTWSFKFCEGVQSEGKNEEALQEHSSFPMQSTGLKPPAGDVALGSDAQGEQDEVRGHEDHQESKEGPQGVTVVGIPQPGGGTLGPEGC